MTQRPATPLCFLLLATAAMEASGLKARTRNTGQPSSYGNKPTQVAVTSAQVADDNKILVSAAWLCEGLECPEGKECTLEQPQCTSEDCSLKPSCSPRLENCKPCNPGCAHAILNKGASTGCHPCLCEIAVVRKPERLTETESSGNSN